MTAGWSSPAWLALAALALPVLALYLLRLRRPRQEVPSLALWRQALADERVNSPFQRFRRHLSLWLALAALAAIALAAARPWLGGGGDGAAEAGLPVLIDVSASMGGRGADGGTPLAAARARVLALIAGLRPGERLSLVAVGARPRRLCGFSDDPRLLRAALAELAAEAGGADLAAACRLLGVLAREAPCQRALLISDGNLAAAVDAEPPLPIDLDLVPPAGPNLGITACAARRGAPGRWQVLVQVDASADAAGGARLRIERAGEAEALAERACAPGPGGSQRLTIEVAAAAEQELVVRLLPDGPDSLAVDDIAHLALPALRPLRVQVAPGLAAWRRALAAQEDVALDAGDPDLVVSDRAGDLDGGAALALGVGLVPAPLADLVAVQAEGGSAVIDLRLGEPLLAHVALGDLVIAERVAWRPGADEGAIERRGFSVLVHGDHGPLAVAGRSGGSGGERAYLLFHSDRSTLAWRLAFPLLAGNLVERARTLRGLDQAASARTGLLTLAGCTPGGSVRLDGDGDASSTATADGDGVAAGLVAARPGWWTLVDGDRRRRLGTALLDRDETRLARVDRLQLREVAVAARPPDATPAERALWPWFALLAALLLIVDWWWAHRRW